MKRIGAKGPAARAVRTPTVLQMEAVECGAAALSIVLGYHRRFVSLPELRAACGVSRDGSNAANVVRAARSYGLIARGVSADLEDLRDLPMPCIVFWNFNHFIVVEGVVGDRVRINDPAVGRRSILVSEFDEGFTGVVLTFAPGPEFVSGGRPASPMRALRARLGRTPRELWPCVVAGLLLTVPGLALPMGMQLFVDRVLVGGQAEWLRPLIVGLALLHLAQLALSALKARYLREWHSRLSTRLTGGFLWHALRLPVSFFAQRYAGEIGGRAALNSGIAQALSGQLAAAAIDATMVVFYAAVMLAYDVPLTLLGIFFAGGNVAILRWIARRRADAALRARQESGKLAGVSIAGLQSMETIKASALESSFFTRWAGHHARAVEAQQELGRTQQSLAVLPGLLSALTAAAILIYGGLRVMDGHITLGALVAFVGLMANFQRPVGTLTQLAGQLQTLQADLMRVDDVLRNPLDVETERPSALADEEPPPLRGSVELRGVTFGFSRSAPPLIVDLNLRLDPGQRVALVGGSGSGKSTIAGLVCGLHQPWSGEILIDGLPRSRHSRARLAGTLALVDQDVALFSGSVRENLTLWDPQVSQEQLEAACRDAEILDVVRALPGGFDADLLENGANLSGGQRQRLEIARALVGSPPLLVLDEATSALDAATEARVDANLRRRGCATLIVAHRLSTVRDADEILVLRAGQVVQRGRHDELAREEGDFRRLIVGEGDST